jgi:outer membrane receptor protein involved in Fe transport
LFYTDWNHIQSDFLLSNGLISTQNAGHGRILGLEASLEWRLTHDLQVTAGGTAINASLISTENGLKLDDLRLPVVPDFTARLAISYGVDLGAWRANLSAQANYVGVARLSFDPDLDRKMGDYAPVSASASLTRGRLGVSARIDNVFDITGDSFAFGNQFSILHSQQYTPLRPRTFTLALSRSW